MTLAILVTGCDCNDACDYGCVDSYGVHSRSNYVCDDVDPLGDGFCGATGRLVMSVMVV